MLLNVLLQSTMVNLYSWNSKHTIYDFNERFQNSLSTNVFLKKEIQEIVDNTKQQCKVMMLVKRYAADTEKSNASQCDSIEFNNVNKHGNIKLIIQVKYMTDTNVAI